MSKTIARDELRAALDAGSVTVVDALPSGAFQRRHLPGAVNLAAEEIDEASDRLPDPDAPIRHTTSCSATVMSMPRKTCRLSKDLRRPSIRSAGAAANSPFTWRSWPSDAAWCARCTSRQSVPSGS